MRPDFSVGLRSGQRVAATKRDRPTLTYRANRSDRCRRDVSAGFYLPSRHRSDEAELPASTPLSSTESGRPDRVPIPCEVPRRRPAGSPNRRSARMPAAAGPVPVTVPEHDLSHHAHAALATVVPSTFLSVLPCMRLTHHAPARPAVGPQRLTAIGGEGGADVNGERTHHGTYIAETVPKTTAVVNTLPIPIGLLCPFDAGAASARRPRLVWLARI